MGNDQEAASSIMYPTHAAIKWHKAQNKDDFDGHSRCTHLLYFPGSVVSAHLHVAQQNGNLCAAQGLGLGDSCAKIHQQPKLLRMLPWS
jgi:hypothetical protein